MSVSAPAPRCDWALFLDFDGTLVDLASRPSALRPHPDLAPTLRRASAALGSALAVVSGRPIGEIDHWLAASVAAVAGGHGLERRSADGRLHPAAAPPAGELARARADLARVADAHGGVRLEDKGYGLALHFRAAPQWRDACAAAVRAHASPAFEVLEGSMVFELRPRGVHKGLAVDRFMDEAPFAGRTPVFVGDDLTDEDGFRTVNARGGVSILVGPARATSARHRMPGVDSVLAWLRAIPDTVGEAGSGGGEEKRK